MNPHMLKRAGERVYQGMVLVDLRARMVATSRMVRACVCHTAPHRTRGTLVARSSSIPKKAPCRGHELRR